MDLYTLGPDFLAENPIDQFVSAIWTERYTAAGEVSLVVPATADYISKLAEGTFLALRGTKEIMILETQSIENNLMTVAGRSLITFLDQRMSWWAYGGSDDPVAVENRVQDFTSITRKPGELISYVVDKMVINPVAFADGGADIHRSYANLDWVNDAIPNLVLGQVDTSGVVDRFTIPVGPLYQSIQGLAEQQKVGISLYLDHADHSDYLFKFDTYRGVDHGGNIRLSPKMDSLSGIKELRSAVNYKNVVYVYYAGKITTHLLPGEVVPPVGFERRVLLTDAVGEPVGHKETRYNYGGGWYGFGPVYRTPYEVTVVSDGEIAAFREQNAQDALANHNYIQTVDGEISPISEYRFGTDYGLGDIIELEGLSGIVTRAQVTEYVRSQDKNGQKEFPTISVI